MVSPIAPVAVDNPFHLAELAAELRRRSRGLSDRIARTRSSEATYWGPAEVIGGCVAPLGGRRRSGTREYEGGCLGLEERCARYIWYLGICFVLEVANVP